MEDVEQPNHEIDVLSGHENDVNYVQFRLVFSAWHNFNRWFFFLHADVFTASFAVDVQ